VRAVEADAARWAEFEVSASCVIKLVQRWRRGGTLEAEPRRGGSALNAFARLAMRTRPGSS
jgi:transposase